jgi:hypothetical protein
VGAEPAPVDPRHGEPGRLLRARLGAGAGASAVGRGQETAVDRGFAVDPVHAVDAPK